MATENALPQLVPVLPRPRGIAHVAAAVLFAVNPYTMVLANRTTATLVGYAALPWLLLCVHRGLRDPRRWWWPAAFGLVLTSTGGGVNAAVTAWILPGPLLLLLYEPLIAGVPWRSVRSFGWRTAATGQSQNFSTGKPRMRKKSA